MATVQVLIQIKIVWIFMPVVPVSRCDKMITIAKKYNPLYIFSSLAVCLPAWEPLKNICHFPQVGNCWWMIFLVYQLLLFALSTLSPSVCTLSQKGKKKIQTCSSHDYFQHSVKETVYTKIETPRADSVKFLYQVPLLHTALCTKITSMQTKGISRSGKYQYAEVLHALVFMLWKK